MGAAQHLSRLAKTLHVLGQIGILEDILLEDLPHDGIHRSVYVLTQKLVEIMPGRLVSTHIVSFSHKRNAFTRRPLKSSITVNVRGLAGFTPEKEKRPTKLVDLFLPQTGNEMQSA